MATFGREFNFIRSRSSLKTFLEHSLDMKSGLSYSLLFLCWVRTCCHQHDLPLGWLTVRLEHLDIIRMYSIVYHDCRLNSFIARLHCHFFRLRLCIFPHMNSLTQCVLYFFSRLCVLKLQQQFSLVRIPHFYVLSACSVSFRVLFFCVCIVVCDRTLLLLCLNCSLVML